MTINEVIQLLEQWAPPVYQESYDNSGLLVGNPQAEVQKALITLDCTETVVDEAIREGCNIIIAHHPILFSGIKRLTGKNYVERTLMKAIKNDIAIYAIHTNLDNISSGVNAMMAAKLGLTKTQILLPKKQVLRKLITYIPTANFGQVSQAVFNAGAGHIGNYSHCGFSVRGQGSFKGNEISQPAIGKPQQLELIEEMRFETIYPVYLEASVLSALKMSHPYEEVAYDIFSLENENPLVGSGLIGELEKQMDLEAFLAFVKEQFHLKTLKYSSFSDKIKRVALCGGSGSFLRVNAMAAKADAYITSDIKYHEWFDAEGKIGLIDIGHYESEQYTKELILNYLKKKALSLPTQISMVNTNPVNYL